MFSRRTFAALSALLLGAALAAPPARAGEIVNPLLEGATWAELKPDVVGEAPLLDGAGLFDLDAPYRAHDAATVPVRIVQAPETGLRIVRLTLVVDENPAPVVAEFEFGPAMGRIELETRVRVNQYSNIRAIAQTEDGRLWMTGRYVKGAGGCSAPALKDMDAALASAGQMRMKLFETAAEGALPHSGGRREAQVMIRHPNYSGLQRNQITQLFIPAFFVDELEVRLGDETLFRMHGGISISEDPSFRFSHDDNGAMEFRIRAHDTDGHLFEQAFPASGSAS